MSYLRLVKGLVVDWGMRCFGVEHMINYQVRALRLVGEAIELAQAVDVPVDRLHACVGVVYSRPKGDTLQELGGVFITAIAMAGCCGFAIEDVIETELHRCLSKTPEHFAERNKEKLNLGLTG